VAGVRSTSTAMSSRGASAEENATTFSDRAATEAAGGSDKPRRHGVAGGCRYISCVPSVRDPVGAEHRAHGDRPDGYYGALELGKQAHGRAALPNEAVVP